MNILPKPNSSITHHIFDNIICEKKNLIKICSKYNIKKEELQQILYSSGNSIFIIKKMLYFKYREYKRIQAQALYTAIYNSIWEDEKTTPTKINIENTMICNNRLLEFYKFEFEAFNQYLNSLLTNDQCFICQDTIDTHTSQNIITIPKEAFVALSCNHCFHISCIGEWLKNHDDCPTCRRVIQLKNSSDIFEESDNHTQNDINYNTQEDNVTSYSISSNTTIVGDVLVSDLLEDDLDSSNI